MHIQVVTCSCGFQMRVTISDGWGVARPDRGRWEKLCAYQIATDPMSCSYLQAALEQEFHDDSSSRDTRLPLHHGFRSQRGRPQLASSPASLVRPQTDLTRTTVDARLGPNDSLEPLL